MVAASLIVAACATVDQAPLAYEFPAESAAVKAALIESYISSGYRVTSETDHTLKFERYKTAGEALLQANMNFSYEIAVTGNNPTRVTPRVVATFGGRNSDLIADGTARSDLRAQLLAPFDPVASRFRARKL